MLCNCFKNECCIRSRSIYSLKKVIPWHYLDFFILSNVYLIVRTIIIFTRRNSATCLFSRSVFGKCFKDDNCVGSRSRYSLKWGIYWHFLILFHVIIYVPYCITYCYFHTKTKFYLFIVKNIKCCKDKWCVVSRGSYSLKWGISWNFFIIS